MCVYTAVFNVYDREGGRILLLSIFCSFSYTDSCRLHCVLFYMKEREEINAEQQLYIHKKWLYVDMQRVTHTFRYRTIDLCYLAWLENCWFRSHKHFQASAD